MKFKQPNDFKLLKTKLMYSMEHQLVIALLARYVNLSRETTAEEALAKYVFDNIEAQALTILSIVTVYGKKSPIQNIIGNIASALLEKKLESGKVIATYQCVAEFVMASPEIFIRTTSFYGGSKVTSPLYDRDEAEKKMFQLPSFNGPTKRHKSLGVFDWEISNSDAIDKLNNVPITVLNFEEQSIPVEGTEDRIKYDIREAFRPLFAKEKTNLYFDWNMDYRGRMYPNGYHFTLHGNEYEKNIMTFAKVKQLSSMEQVISMIEVRNAIAVAFGKDKITDAEKQKWYDENKNTLDWRTAKEPTYARAQMLSLELLQTTGTTNIPVELDATCSQKQVVAVLTGDAQTATCCNIITDNSHIQDAYKLVADEMSSISGLKFNRKQIKKSDMIDGYGAGEERITEQLKEDLKEYYYDGVVDVFYKAINTVCPMAGTLKTVFQSLWNNTRTEWNWTLPDGFKVKMLTTESRQITVNPFGMEEISIIGKMIIPTSKNTSLGVNIIHSVDAYIARQMIVRCAFDVIPIHDGFRCLPVYARQMRTIYNSIMAEITDSTLLEDIIKEIAGVDIKLPKQFNGTHVMNSKYAIS